MAEESKAGSLKDAIHEYQTARERAFRVARMHAEYGPPTSHANVVSFSDYFTARCRLLMMGVDVDALDQELDASEPRDNASSAK